MRVAERMLYDSAHCPLDRCNWQLDVTSVPGGVKSFVEELGFHFESKPDNRSTPRISQSAEMGAFILEEHMRQHTPCDWLDTIQRLRSEITELQRRDM